MGHRTSVQGVPTLKELISSESRVSATVIQTVGAKGYDGFALALVTGGLTQIVEAMEPACARHEADQQAPSGNGITRLF